MLHPLRSIVILLLTAAPLVAAEPVFWERDGLVVFEIESAPPSGSWSVDRDLSGYTGAGYYTWGGDNAYRAAGGGVLGYRIRITTPGRYQLRIRNRHDHEDHTLHNDCFTRMDGGDWVKTFSSKRGEWTWHTRHEFSHDDKPDASYQLSAGEHRFEISGRSSAFSIDRVHLFLEDASAALDETRPESSAGPAMPELSALPKVARWWAAGALGRALKAAEDAQQDEAVASGQAQAAVEALTGFATAQHARIAALKAQAPAAAVTALAELAGLYAGHDLGKTLQAEAIAWSKEPAVRAMIEADAIHAAMGEAAARLDRHGDAGDPAWLKRNQRQLKTIVAGWQRLEAQYPEAPATVRARSLIEDLGLRELQ